MSTEQDQGLKSSVSRRRMENLSSCLDVAPRSHPEHNSPIYLLEECCKVVVLSSDQGPSDSRSERLQSSVGSAKCFSVSGGSGNILGHYLLKKLRQENKALEAILSCGDSD